MSGSMQMAPQAMPQGAAPQMSPQMMAMLAQRMQQQGGASPMPQRPPMLPQQGAAPPMPPRPPMPPPPQELPSGSMPGAAPPPPQGMPPGLAMFGRAAQARPSGQLPPGLNPHEAASMGRFGDTVLSHLQPGEIVINPRYLPPQLVQQIVTALKQSGVNLSAMVVGQGPKNPNTGIEEHNSIFDELLPALLGIGGAVVAPEALPFLGLDGAIGAGDASSIGAGLGSAAGTAATGGNIGQTITSGLGAAAGNSLMSGLAGAGGSSAGAASVPTTNAAGDAIGQGAATTTPFGPGSAALASQYADAGMGASMLPDATGTAASGAGSGLTTGQYAMRGLGSALGGTIGGALAPATVKMQLPQGSIPYYNPSGPNPQSGAPSRPTFTNYNPFASATGQPYNFFPTPG